MSEYTITKENFETEVLKSSQLVLIDFWAPWCGPCQIMAPVMAEIALEYPEVKVCTINVDEEIELAEAFDVLSIPTLVIMKNGRVRNSYVGLCPREVLDNMLKGAE